jgi:type VI secretion system secreted protein VgrG
MLGTIRESWRTDMNMSSTELDGLTPAKTVGTDSPASLLQAAGAATQAAGADPKATAALGAAGQVTGLAQSLGGASGATPAAGVTAKGSGALQAAQSAVAGIGASFRAEPSYLDQHPLAGQSISDFATAMLPFAPNTPLPDPAREAVGAGPDRLSQDTRLLRFYSPLADDKKLFVEAVSGQSALSSPFTFRARLVAQNASIDLKDLLAKNVTVGVLLQNGSEYPLNGYVSQFGFSHSDGGLAYYDAEIVPWLWYLNYRTNSRIYQDQSVLGVIEKVFTENYGGMAKFELRTSSSYQPESFIVQYDESDFNFVSRLLEQYGLFYYFEHTASEHTLIITDDSRNGGFCPPHTDQAQIRFNAGQRIENEDCVTQLASRRSFQSSRVSLNTFDFKAPSSPMYVEMPTVAEQGSVPELEVYHGNPAFAYRTASAGEADARLRMEAIECQAKLFIGASECRGLTTGHSFKLVGHFWFDANDADDNDFLVLSVDVNARNNLGQQDERDTYGNSFTCIRRKIPFRPQRVHQKPVMKGPQTATVVGPKGEEIHTDEFGRIKVQFHWDRYGHHDERSSCWIRVSQPWAGKSWGTVAIPRVGQEVIIDFLEGDPDRPICVGRLFNTEQPPPYGLPDGAHQMGFRSRSTPGGGGHCEMVIHDKAGQEMINIHSQKDMATTVQNNQTTVVNGPERTLAVTKGRYVATVKKEIQVVSETEHVYVKADTNITVALGEDHFITLDKESGVIQLVVGESALVMNKDGTITIQGKKIESTAAEVHVIKGGQIHLNP